MKATRTRVLTKVLASLGCVKGETVGSHQKWTAPGGHSTSVVLDREQSPGALRNIQKHLEPEFGPGWLERELRQ